MFSVRGDSRSVRLLLKPITGQDLAELEQDERLIRVQEFENIEGFGCCLIGVGFIAISYPRIECNMAK